MDSRFEDLRNQSLLEKDNLRNNRDDELRERPSVDRDLSKEREREREKTIENLGKANSDLQRGILAAKQMYEASLEK